MVRVVLEVQSTVSDHFQALIKFSSRFCPHLASSPMFWRLQESQYRLKFFGHLGALRTLTVHPQMVR